MMIAASFVLSLVALASQQQLAVSQSADLATVKELYASASFEEALSKLSLIEETVGIEQTEQYRALCLLGLGRTSDAEKSLERMIVANPLYVVPDTEVSPRLVSMFREVRRRLLPAAARDLYVEAKTNYDAKRYGPAATQFRELLSVLTDSDMEAHAEGLRDLGMLAEGFLKLSEGEQVAARRAAEQQAAAAATAPVADAGPRVPLIYADGDEGITAAVELDRRMPAWNPPAAIARHEYRGLLEVTIDERGLVESAVMRRPAHASYDPLLLTALRNWRFQPAMHNGRPVKFRKSFEIVLSRR
jgi:TonB family protein